MKKIFAVAAVAVCAVLAACGGKAGNPLLGQWAYESYVYNFQNDSVGTYDCLGQTMNFNYRTSNDTLYITYEGNTGAMGLKYELTPEALTVYDSFGSPIVYEKK